VRGVPNNPVPCRRCPSGHGSRKDGLCRGCRLQRYRYGFIHEWSAEQDAEIRAAYTRGAAGKKLLTREITRLASSWKMERRFIKQRAYQLGLKTFGGRGWSRVDDEMLRDYAGRYLPGKIAHLLGRSYSAVMCRLMHLSLSARLREGYHLNDLVACFGVHWTLVKKWESRRWLRRAADGRFTEREVRRFILEHLAEIPLKKVDEAWFKGMLDQSYGQRRGPARVADEENKELSA
jgi:hypothetical protein